MRTSTEGSSLAAPVGQEIAIFAGGCFWGVEDLLRNIPGVVKTRVGYTGGNTPNPHYESVKSGITGHTEAVKIVFEPAKVSYTALLDFFFKMHDPTTLNRQGNDRGSQYRSAVYYLSDDQKSMALDKIKEWELAGHWKGSIVTEVTKAGPFYDAEEYHQDYLVKNPGGYTCHYYRDF